MFAPRGVVLLALFICCYSALKVGFLLPGNLSDFGYNYVIWAGIQSFQADFPSVVTEYTLDVATPDCIAVATDYMNRGFDMLYFLNSPMLACAHAMAMNYPTKQFVMHNATAISPMRPNLATETNGGSEVTGGIDDAHFILSVLAVTQRHQHETESVREICLIMSGAYPFKERIANRILLGMRYADPNDKLHLGFTRGFNDPPTEKIVIDHFIAYGCDIVMQHGINSIYPQQYLASATANLPIPIWGTGIHSDMSDFAGENVLASIVVDWNRVFTYFAEIALQGTLTNDNYARTLQNGGLFISDYSCQVTKDARIAANKVQRKILAGKVNTLCQPLIEEIFNKPCATVAEVSNFYFQGITFFNATAA